MHRSNLLTGQKSPIYSFSTVLSAGRTVPPPPMSPPVEVVYITSLGHSGSTLLDLLLSAHPSVFSVGEIVNLGDYAHLRKVKNEQSRLGNECTCGATDVWQCGFWTRVEQDLVRRSGVSLRDMDMRCRDADRFARENRLLFEAVAQASGCSVIVDSSKDPRRLARLLRVEGLRIRPVHLVRDARGVVYSQLRRGRSLVGMCIEVNRRTLQIHRSLRKHDHRTVRYEELVAEPRDVLRPLMNWLGPGWDEGQLEWANRERHNLGGNWMRRATDSTIRLDTAWRVGLSTPRQEMTRLLTLPARLLVTTR